MKQMEIMNSSRKSEYNDLEPDFTGYKNSDELAISVVEKKKRLLQLELQIKKSKLLEKDDPLNGGPPVASIVNSNHVDDKKRKSKSNVFSPETLDKKNQNVNKRLKKENLPSETGKPVEVNVAQSIELSTPTFNITYTPKPRRSVGRKINVDISDPIFKLPFEHGWKRELVYRTTGDYTSNRTNRNGDVYYYSPNNRKLRSLREIQEQLNLSLSDDNLLTIDSFTFLKQPVGINDRSKELIRDANTKLSKEDSFSGNVNKSKKSKTPVLVVEPELDHELSNNENNKSSNKMKIVFKNTKKGSKLKSIKDKSSSITINTSITPDYVTEDWKAIQSAGATPLAEPSEVDEPAQNNAIDKTRLSTSDGEVIMQTPCGIRCPNSDKPATLMCAQCLVYYHPACVNLNANLKIVGYVCVNCRSSVRQRNRRTQSSHTVVVGASEPEQLRVEPIRIRQVSQASDTPNFFIDRTPISKTEESCEINEHSDKNSFVTNTENTVVCQGKVYKTAMIDGFFYEQYVYEMKQTRGPSLMTCVVQEPKNLDENAEINGSIQNSFGLDSTMQRFNYLAFALKYVFKYLKVHELLGASRVCHTWRLIAMQPELWQNVRLKNSMVYDWNKFVDTINQQNTVSLDTRRMLIPKNNFDSFWLCFSKDLKRAVKLKTIELYRCPTHVVEDIIYSLPQLEVLNASSIKNPLLTKDVKHANDFMTLSLKYLSSVQNLTEIRLKGLSGIKLTELPSFKNLTNLRTLSLTSIKSFPKDTFRALDSVTSNLEHLAIGDCDCLFKDFAGSLRKFFNLKSLRLENCSGSWNLFAQETFCAIRSLNNLSILELINIDFTDTVEEELEKCCHIRSLLIIPAYISQSATTNCHLIECLKKLAPTLTHVIWGLTNELLRVTDLFISQYQENKHSIGYHLELNDAGQGSNNIPILKSRKPKQKFEEADSAPENDQKSDNVDIMSVPALEKLLETIMVCAKTKLIKVAFSGTTRVYLSDYFNDL